jgi:hypothetical protein
LTPDVDFVGVLVFERDDGWVTIEPHTVTASHPEIAYQLLLDRGRHPRGSRRFLGLAELEVKSEKSLEYGEMLEVQGSALVRDKDSLSAFQDPRWRGVPHDPGELVAARREPPIVFTLEGLEAIPWGRFSHAYGAATDVPVYLRSLGSDDPEVRREARGSLIMTIFHQGSVYSATAVALPFLLRFVAHPSYPDRLTLMDLVEGIVAECRFDANRRRPPGVSASSEDPGSDPAHRAAPAQNLEADGDPDPDLAVFDVLWADLDLLEQLSEDLDPYVCDMAVRILERLKGGNADS